MARRHAAARLAQLLSRSLLCGHTWWSRKFSTVVVTWPRTAAESDRRPGDEHAVIGPVDLQDVRRERPCYLAIPRLFSRPADQQAWGRVPPQRRDRQLISDIRTPHHP